MSAGFPPSFYHEKINQVPLKKIQFTLYCTYRRLNLQTNYLAGRGKRSINYTKVVLLLRYTTPRSNHQSKHLPQQRQHPAPLHICGIDICRINQESEFFPWTETTLEIVSNEEASQNLFACLPTNGEIPFLLYRSQQCLSKVQIKFWG